MRKAMKVLFSVLHVLSVATAIGLGYRAGWMLLQQTDLSKWTPADYMIMAAILLVNSVIAMEIGNGKDSKKEPALPES